MFCILIITVLITLNLNASTNISLVLKVRYDLSKQQVEKIGYSGYTNDLTNKSFTVKGENCEYSIENNLNEVEDNPIAYVKYPTDALTALGRTTNSRFRNTVYISSIAPNGSSYRGTGFMIGPSAVATLAHNVFNSDYGGNYFIKSGTVFPGYNDGNTPYGSAKIKNIIVYTPWLENFDKDYDLAILELDSNIGDKVGWLGLRYQEESYIGTAVNISGFPKHPNNFNVESMLMCFTKGTISLSTERVLRSNNTKTQGGMSGAPVCIYSEDSGNTVIALHRATAIVNSTGEEFNTFLRITKPFFWDLVAYRDIRV
ncbi:MAG: trypsin-like peptidase domain-containing protein [Clostridia bacterium]|nr:trypsin-like peptidase domain-containing protein [Clostridia bacterium]